MDIWQKAKSIAEEMAKRSQTITVSSAKIADIVSETSKKSKEFAAEASKKAGELTNIALQQADHHIIKPLAHQIPSISALQSQHSHSHSPPSSELEKFGVTDDLRDFVNGLTLSTFQNFPVQDEVPTSDIPAVSNVRQDLTEWQQKHATLVLSTVKEISRLRYELCPRLMKERKFWKIYFLLVSSHVTPYEKQYMEEVKLKEEEQVKEDKLNQTPTVGETSKSEGMGANLKHRTSTSSSTEQDLDAFLLGDLEDSDGGPDGDDGETFDDDFETLTAMDVEDEKQLK